MQRAEICERLLAGFEVRLGDDFHERGAGAVEVDERRVAEMGGLGDILFQVDAVEADDLAGTGDVLAGIRGITMVIERDSAANTERQFHLRRLIVLGHVRIEIILAVPFGYFGRRTPDHESGQQGLFDGFAVEDGQGTGQAKADRTGMGVGRVSERGAAGAEHLGGGLYLAVDFKADGD